MRSPESLGHTDGQLACWGAGVDVHGFCTHIMADNKPFFTDVHVNMGDEQVRSRLLTRVEQTQG